MSNQYTACVNLTQDPEELTLGERTVIKLRCADNTFGKNAETRFFDALVAGPDVDAAVQLKKGDQVLITGQLTKTSYKSKKGKNKGKTMEADSMPFAKLMQITRSPTFFSGEGKPDDADAENAEEPDISGDAADEGDGTSPLDGIV